jgi:gas vesicle structural protein
MTAPVLQNSGGGLADVLNVLLDKGLVIDASVRVSLIGIEILSIEIKVVIASVDTYLRYLEAMQRLDAARRGVLVPAPNPQGIGGTFGLLTSAVPVPAVVAQPVVQTTPPAKS